jgi:hypothetical protein
MEIKMNSLQGAILQAIYDDYMNQCKARNFSDATIKSYGWRFIIFTKYHATTPIAEITEESVNEVHHIIELTPENIGDQTVAINPDNLISLCHNCHTKRTKGSGEKPEDYEFDDSGIIVRPFR